MLSGSTRAGLLSIAQLALLTITAGCAAFREVPKPVPVRLAARVTYELTSDLPELFTVLSGPAESYRRFPVNGLFRSALAELMAAKSDPSSQRLASVAVRLDNLFTSYREIGADRGPPASGLRYAMAGAAETRTDVPAFLLPSVAWGSESDVSIPTEIRKGVLISWAAEIRTPEGASVKESFQTHFLEVVERDHFEQTTSYDYGVPIRAAIGEAVATLDRLLDRVLAAPGPPPPVAPQ